MIIAGQKFGQYISQYDARSLASPGTPQSNINSQLIIGINDTVAASSMKLRYQSWPSSGTALDLAAWTKQHLRAGHPVLVGLFMKSGNDPDYDHIVPINEFTATSNLANAVLDTDTISFFDLGVEGPTSNVSSSIKTYSLKELIHNRAESKTSAAKYYSLKPNQNYAIAITGIVDLQNETLPVSVESSAVEETPVLADGSNNRPASKPHNLTIRISNLTIGQNYLLYRYSSFANTPTSQFKINANKASRTWSFTATQTSTEFTETLQTNDMAIYRAVKDSP